MENAIPKPSGVQSPVWAWKQYRGEAQRRPDLRYTKTEFLREEAGVRLELEVPDELVLLSDFELWHYPLNRWYLPRSEEDERGFETELQTGGWGKAQFDEFPQYFQRRAEKSWISIFDFAFEWQDLTRPLNQKSIQATVWELKLEWVVGLELFYGTRRFAWPD